MTSAHRPTWDPVRAKQPANTGITYERALPSHTTLKVREPSQHTASETREERRARLRHELLAKEAAYAQTQTQTQAPAAIAAGPAAPLSLTEKGEIGGALVAAHPSTAMSLNTPEDNNIPESNESSDEPENDASDEPEDEPEDDSSDEDALRNELEAIKRKRAADVDIPRRPKRSWKEDSVFSLEAAPRTVPQTHTNDTIHGEKHTSFMKKFVR